MANPITQIILTAVDRTKAGFASVKNSLFGVSRDAEQATSRLSNVGNSISGMFGKLGLSFAALYNVRALGGILDDFSNLQSRLKLASRSTEEYNAANADLVRISESAKSPISETATLYTRIAAAVKDLDVSQKDVAGTTEAIALALRLSGASAAESSSAMLQFSQAMASGVLRGEEFNSVNEAAPRVMQALAKSLGVPVGQLREMAKEGQLTRDVLINGLLKQLPELRGEAASLPETFGSSFTKLKNQLFLAAGEFDKATGLTKSFSEALGAIGKTGIEALAVTGANVAFVFKAIGREIGGIAAQLAALATGDIKGASFIGKAMKEDAELARKALDDFEKKILDGDKNVKDTREKNSNETRDVVIGDKEAEEKAFKDSTNEQISDAKRLDSALQSAFSASLDAEKDYLRQAKKLRAEANGRQTVGDDPESQATARLDAVTAAMKLQRTAGTDSLESTRDQAEALRALAEQLDDVALKTDLRRQANLAEAAALEKAAAVESQRARELSKQQDENDRRAETAKAALDGAGKLQSVEIKSGPGTAKTIEDLEKIKHLIEFINNAGPINTTASVPGASASADALRTAALQYGRRQ
jgi:tape measure domain-containing protein